MSSHNYLMDDNSGSYCLSYSGQDLSTSRSANDKVHNQKSDILRATDKEDKVKMTDAFFWLDHPTREAFFEHKNYTLLSTIIQMLPSVIQHC